MDNSISEKSLDKNSMPNYEKFFSKVALARRPSPIRVLTAIQMASGPEMISLAGGMPNPSKFPIDKLSLGVSGRVVNGQYLLNISLRRKATNNCKCSLSISDRNTGNCLFLCSKYYFRE